MRVARIALVAALLFGCAQLREDEPQMPGIVLTAAEARALTKIRFDLDALDANGLQGPADGKRALHYELCVPSHPDVVRTVLALDPTLVLHPGARGRVGCGEDELLGLGSTHQPDHRAVLARLAALPEVREIREAFFE